MRNYLVLLIALLSPLGAWAYDAYTATRDITIPAWSTDSVYGDNTVYEMNLTSNDIMIVEPNVLTSVSTGGVFLEPFPAVPSVGDKRCLDSNCNYYLDISDVRIRVRENFNLYYEGPWEDGEFKGIPGGSAVVGPTQRDVTILSSSKIKIKKRQTGPATLPTQSKMVSISLKQCDPSTGAFGSLEISRCNNLDSPYAGIKLTLNINVPAPTPPKVQCYMTPWSNSIDFQPVTVPVESSKAGQANWPLGGAFTGVEQQSSHLDVRCYGINEAISAFPLQVKLSGTGWTYGPNGELYFGNEKNIAVAATLKMAANSKGSLSLDASNNAACQNFWETTGHNAFEMGAKNLGAYLSTGSTACQFTQTLPTPHEVIEEFRLTLDAILGVTTQQATTTPTYEKHTGALMLDINSL